MTRLNYTDATALKGVRAGMIRRSRYAGSEDDGIGTLTSFASVSDLMTALLAMFLLVAAVLVADNGAVRAQLSHAQSLLTTQAEELTTARAALKAMITASAQASSSAQ